MKYLKLFESFNKEDIDSICRKFGIENYTINEDGSIDVDGNVSLSSQGLTELPLRFRNVTFNFWCSNNNLTSLVGSPQSVGGDFLCFNNKLTSLAGCPQNVGGDFFCYNNKLKTLEGCPKSVGESFHCQNNQLMTLEGMGSLSDIFFHNNPCSPIYKEWINTDRRDELMDMMKDYDFLRGNTINWYLLEAFFNDAGLRVPTIVEFRFYYKIED
jgi:hypothetical protein